MVTKAVRFVITYTISDDDTRNLFTDLLNDLNYESGDDQSTLVITMDKDYYNESNTLNQINRLCADKATDFTSGDQFSFYSIHIHTDIGTKRQISYINKNLYYYNRRLNRFE